MTKHTDNVTVAALRHWILTNQDDTGCREAAETLGELRAVSALLEMLDGPLTARCAMEVAAALGNHADASHLPHLSRHRAEFSAVAAMLDVAMEDIEEDQGECTCGQCNAFRDQGSGSPVRPVGSPSEPHLRN